MRHAPIPPGFLVALAVAALMAMWLFVPSDVELRAVALAQVDETERPLGEQPGDVPTGIPVDDSDAASARPDARGAAGQSIAEEPSSSDPRTTGVGRVEEDGERGVGAEDARDAGQARVGTIEGSEGQTGTGGAGIGGATTGEAATGETATGETTSPFGFGGDEPLPVEELQAEQLRLLEQFQAQQQAALEQQRALQERQQAIAEQVAALEQLEAQRVAQAAHASASLTTRLDLYEDTLGFLLEADRALERGALDVEPLLRQATDSLATSTALADDQGRAPEGDAASMAREEILRALEAAGRRDVYAARLALQTAGAHLGVARLDARQTQTPPLQ